MTKITITMLTFIIAGVCCASTLSGKKSVKENGEMNNKKAELPDVVKLFAGMSDLSKQDKSLKIPGKGGNSLNGMINIQFKLKKAIDPSRLCEAGKIPFFHFPGFAKMEMVLSGYPGKERRELRWLWKGANSQLPSQRMALSYFESGKSYNLTYSWNAKKGLLDCYLNGSFLRGHSDSWRKEVDFQSVELPKGDYILEDVSYSNDYFNGKQVASLLGVNFPVASIEEIGQNFGGAKFKAPKMKVVYANPMAAQRDLKDWVMEGPGKLVFKDGWTEIESPSTPPQDCSGHQTFWCPFECPEDYLLEWEFKTINGKGLCILFIDAKGLNGEDVLGDKLAPRNGNFPLYWKGDFRNYHFSFLDGGRWIRVNKNPFKTLFCQGYRPAYEKGKTYKMSLLKQGNTITMAIDGVICFVAEDEKEKYGTPWHGGKMAFRQMLPSHTAYRNFKISVPVAKKGEL
jgi:uncharacterized protein DUF1961